jgi:hypothetical protein
LWVPVAGGASGKKDVRATLGVGAKRLLPGAEGGHQGPPNKG